MAIEAEPVKLADQSTLDILNTNWLKEHDKAAPVAQRIGFSSTFWTFVAVLVIVGGGAFLLVL